MLPKRATSPANEIMETESTGATVRRYLRLPGSVDETFLMIDYSAGGVAMETWAHRDRLGSTVATSDAVGVVLDTYTYDDFGNSGAEGTSGFPFRFTGQKLDPETGLMYYKARYYSADLGRFLQVDPIGYEDQMNMYAYVANDPVNMIDPDGQCGRPRDASTTCKNFFQGVLEGATGSYTAYRVSQQAMSGDPRAQFIFLGMGAGLDIAMAYPGVTGDLAKSSLKNNPAKFAGRVTGASAVGIAVSKGFGGIWRRLGGGSFGGASATASIGLTNLSAGQIGGVANQLGNLYDSANEMGFDPGSLSMQALGDAAVVAAVGGDLRINSETGKVTAKVSKTGSRLRRTVTIGTLDKIEEEK